MCKQDCTRAPFATTACVIKSKRAVRTGSGALHRETSKRSLRRTSCLRSCIEATQRVMARKREASSFGAVGFGVAAAPVIASFSRRSSEMSL